MCAKKAPSEKAPVEMGVTQVVKELKNEFEEIFLGVVKIIEPILLSARNSVQDYASMDDYQRRFSMNFLKEIMLMLKNDELDQRDFFLEAMKKNKFWAPLAKVILVKRIDELKKCKVLKKGRKYNITGLKETFFGKYIADKLGFTRRSVIDEKEYASITTAIKKLKYEVPVVIQPTETEKFFEEKKSST